MYHELQKASKQLDDANANCAKLSAECARLSKLNQVTYYMYSHVCYDHVCTSFGAKCSCASRNTMII